MHRELVFHRRIVQGKMNIYIGIKSISLCVFWLFLVKSLTALGNKIYLIDFFIQTKEKRWEKSRLGTDVGLSTDSLVIIVMWGPAEAGISNVILAVWEDPSIQGGQLTAILHFGELYGSAKAFGYVWKRSKWTHNLQWQGGLKPRICDCAV